MFFQYITKNKYRAIVLKFPEKISFKKVGYANTYLAILSKGKVSVESGFK